MTSTGIRPVRNIGNIYLYLPPARVNLIDVCDYLARVEGDLRFVTSLKEQQIFNLSGCLYFN